MIDILDSALQEQLALRIERQISYQMDEILFKIQNIAKKFAIASKDKKSPFRNVVAVATDSSSSLEVIKNYIRYQVGRSSSSPIWKTSTDNKLFATAVVEDINSLSENAQKILTSIRKEIPNSNDLSPYLDKTQNQEQMKKYLHLKLTQLYLGYLAREHTASVGESNSNQ